MKGFILNPIPKTNLSTIITKMTKADAMPPIIALESVVVAGRTYQAYKRGKMDEARERFIEESSGSVVWLGGVWFLNKIGDKIVDKILKSNGKKFGVGTDKVLRTPFQNFMQKVAPKGFSANQVAMLKGAKVLTSVLIANYVIGFIVPKINHALTNNIRHERKLQNKNDNNNNVAFKGGAMNAVNTFTYAIENTNTGKLLSTDAGVAGGRMYNARSKEERAEIAIRDIGSIYFYMWAQGHVRNLLNLAESGKATRLNPATTKILSEYMTEFLNNREMSVSEFKNAMLGKEMTLPSNILNSTDWEKGSGKKPLEVIKLKSLENLIKDNETLNRAREMSTLQPERQGEAVLTKQQLIDVYNKAEINNPKLLHNAFNDFTEGAYKDEYQFVSNKKLYKLKAEMEQYVDTVCKSSKNGKVNKELIEKVQKKNLMYNGINFAAGFAVAALFLSTLIPKIQYWYTRKTTGVDAFPGVYDYTKHHEVDD